MFQLMRFDSLNVTPVGSYDQGIGIRAAAAEFGLEFIPLLREQYYFVCLKETLNEPAIVKLRELLTHSEWQVLINDLPGCWIII